MKLRAGIEPKDIPLDVRLGLIIFLRYSGHWTYAEIGGLFDISRQRVHQIVCEWAASSKQFVKGAWFFKLNGTQSKPLP